MTARQDIVIMGVAMGMPQKNIAAMLGLSVKGVESHLAKIRRKLGFNDAARLTHYAISRGIVTLGVTT